MTIKMTESEMLSKILEVFPDASIDTDNYGQLIIYTDSQIDDDGFLVKFEESEEDEN